MKQFLLATVLVFATTFCFAQTTSVQNDITKTLKFTNDNYDMGKITYGKPTEFTVDIQNIGATAVTIDNVMVGCGCTTPKYTKGQSIAPGAHASVVLGFNGSTLGKFSKSATIFFSGNMTKSVAFSGEGVQQ
jgi:hypothetical protein